MSPNSASLDYWKLDPIQKLKEFGAILDADDENDFWEIQSQDNIETTDTSRLNRFHLRRLRTKSFLIVNLILWPLFVFIGVELSDSHPPTVHNTLMMSLGVKTMSSTDLVAFIKSENRAVYWLNPLPGYIYSDNSTQDGTDSISYILPESELSNIKLVNLSVKTYLNSTVFDSHVHALVGAGDTKLTTASGAQLEYNKLSPNRMKVTFNNQPEVVIVEYPSAQSEEKLIEDADKLVRI